MSAGGYNYNVRHRRLWRFNTMKWRIYYENGETFEGNPEDAPAFGVVDILQWDNRTEKRRHTCGGDYYLYDKQTDSWLAVDIIGLIDHLAHDGWCLVRFGRTVPNDTYWRIFDRVAKDPFPKWQTQYTHKLILKALRTMLQ